MDEQNGLASRQSRLHQMGVASQNNPILIPYRNRGYAYLLMY